MARIIAIDYGEVRVGIALTDPLQIISSGYKTLTNDKNIFQSILSICKSKEVESLVIGIPFDQNSQIGDSAKKVLVFVGLLMNYFKENNYNIPIYEQDERYTTHEAIDVIKKIKLKKRRKTQVVDQIAAAKILSDFMANSNKVKLDVSKLLSGTLNIHTF
ncbi:MAG: Holliday junction resolvase RuvX [Spirochaetes bacterium]|nr:Holliday junction resolvase RuvX [Spirochaetota bacterium]